MSVVGPPEVPPSAGPEPGPAPAPVEDLKAWRVKAIARKALEIEEVRVFALVKGLLSRVSGFVTHNGHN